MAKFSWVYGVHAVKSVLINKPERTLELFVQDNRYDEVVEELIELARKAGVTVQTIDRIERGFDCRVDTKRKIIEALGCKLSERTKIFMEKKVVTSQPSAKSNAR